MVNDENFVSTEIDELLTDVTFNLDATVFIFDYIHHFVEKKTLQFNEKKIEKTVYREKMSEKKLKYLFFFLSRIS